MGMRKLGLLLVLLFFLQPSSNPLQNPLKNPLVSGTSLSYYLLTIFWFFFFPFLFSFFFFSFSFWFSILCNLNCKPFYYSLAFFSCNISFDFSWGTITMWSHWRLTLFEHYIFMACNIPRHAYLYFQSFLWQIFSLGF